MKTKKCYIAMNLDTNLNTLHLKAGSSVDPVTRLQGYENSYVKGVNEDGAFYLSSFISASSIILQKQFTNFHKQEQKYINTLREFKKNMKDLLKRKWGIQIALHHVKEEDMRGTPYPSERGIDQKLYDMLVDQTFERIELAQKLSQKQKRKAKYETRLKSLDSSDPIKPQIRKAIRSERQAIEKSRELLDQLNFKYYNRRKPSVQKLVETDKKMLVIYKQLKSTYQSMA
jgi:hypothetical protein